MIVNKAISRFLIGATVATTGFFVLGAVSSADQGNQPMTRAQVEAIVHNYLVSNPEVLVEASESLQKKSVWTSVNHNSAMIFFDPASPVVGPTKANVSVVEFFDYQCPYCKKMSPLVLDEMNRDKNIRVVFKELPIFGDSSVLASKAALAAIKQGKYLAMHNALMAQSGPVNQQKVMKIAKSLSINVDQLQKDMRDPIVDNELKNNLRLAESLHINGTPAFVVGQTPARNVKGGYTPSSSKTTTLEFGMMSKESLQQAISKARS
jgi:protein-disulfide isomerase